GDGTAEAEMPASGWLLNSAGLVGGGTLAILADIAFGLAIETKLPPAVPYTTAELSLTFLRPARPGAAITAHGQAIHVGRTVGLAEVFLIDPRDEALLAHGTSRLSIFPPLDGLPRPPTDPPDYEQPSYPDPDPYLRPPPAGAVLPQEVWDRLSGREILERQIRGELPAPPIRQLTGINLRAVGDGAATMTLPASEWLNSPAGRLQGGTIAMLADASLLTAVMTTTPSGTAIAGLDLKVNFLRPVAGDDGELIARARVEHAGRTLAISSARVENADGKPVMLATGSAMYLPGRPATLGPEVELSSDAEREPQ
ncbi:MAG: PaaI family thioesterase, partial [Solirubrobacterales bacterium]